LARKGIDMVSRTWAIVTVAMGLAAPQLACAADDAPVCTSPGSLPDDMTSWRTPVVRNAAASAADLGKAALPWGQAVKVRLLQTPAVTYPMRPAKPGGSVSYGGLLQLTVKDHGSYRVALDSPAWIDLVSASNAPVDSFGHGHGPACTGVRKMVDFVLEPGVYTLEVSATGSAGACWLLPRCFCWGLGRPGSGICRLASPRRLCRRTIRCVRPKSNWGGGCFTTPICRAMARLRARRATNSATGLPMVMPRIRVSRAGKGAGTSRGLPMLRGLRR